MKELKSKLITPNEEIIFKNLLNFYLADKKKKHSYVNKKGEKFKIRTPLPNDRFRVEKIFLYEVIGKDCIFIHITDDKIIKRRHDHKVFIGEITFDLADIEYHANRDDLINYNEIKVIIFNSTDILSSPEDLPVFGPDIFDFKRSIVLPDDTGGGVIVEGP
ncbi:hypothetical protein [Polaribacter septentrionalilitoris]|uniref:hypothetical protein n=1 Tax=Polaribacter septentrionalilitoris TaxID=2494657 RepID=UPI001359DFDC|nr:hypothetical protein [Polaribacter septentrionalilitoris]